MNIVEATFQELYGIVCWQVAWDRNLNLSMHFGQPSLSILEPRVVESKDQKVADSFKYRRVTPRGEWFFWILMGYWRLYIKDFDEVTGAASYKRKRMCLARLDGQKLTSITVNPETSATQLVFDLGATLSIRRLEINNDGHIWTLYQPNGNVLSVRADGKYSYNPGNTELDKHVWKPMKANEC